MVGSWLARPAPRRSLLQHRTMSDARRRGMELPKRATWFSTCFKCAQIHPNPPSDIFVFWKPLPEPSRTSCMWHRFLFFCKVLHLVNGAPEAWTATAFVWLSGFFRFLASSGCQVLRISTRNWASCSNSASLSPLGSKF